MEWSTVVLILGALAIMFIGSPLAAAKYNNSKKMSIFHKDMSEKRKDDDI